MLRGFKEFITKGNVVDLAVGVVIGAAFGALVAAFTRAFINPLIALVLGGGAQGGTFEINGVTFFPGDFLTAIITFLITAAVIYLVVVAPYNVWRNRHQTPQDEARTNEERMVELLEQIARK